MKTSVTSSSRSCRFALSDLNRSFSLKDHDTDDGDVQYLLGKFDTGKELGARVREMLWYVTSREKQLPLDSRDRFPTQFKMNGDRSLQELNNIGFCRMR